MPADPLTALIRHLNQSVLSLAALGGALRLHEAGLDAHPAISEAMAEALDALGAPPLLTLSPCEARQALGLIRTFLVEAADLVDAPARPPGWTFNDPAILQGIGTSSAGMVARMAALASGRPWLHALFTRPGIFLDIGTGVGGIALAAAETWSGMDVVGIDLWQPSLDLAERNRAQSPAAARITFRNQPLQDLDDVARYDLAWLPTMFIAGAVVTDALPRLQRALIPGAGLIVGVLPPFADPLGAALGRLRTIRNGGHPWSPSDVARLLASAGFENVEIPPDQPGINFVLAQNPPI